MQNAKYAIITRVGQGSSDVVSAATGVCLQAGWLVFTMICTMHLINRADLAVPKRGRICVGFYRGVYHGN